jgi:hypothetical protein
MKLQSVSFKCSKSISTFFAIAVFSLCSVANVSADPITPEVQAKVDQYKKKLQEWATNPVLIDAVMASNAKGGLVADMTNAKWEELKGDSPVVSSFQTSAAGKYLTGLEQDKGINKLYARDEKGNLVAGSNKPAVYNVADRPPFKNAIMGKVYADAETKADPSTHKVSIQVSAPILSAGKTIGVLHTAVNAN